MLLLGPLPQVLRCRSILKTVLIVLIDCSGARDYNWVQLSLLTNAESGFVFLVYGG